MRAVNSQTEQERADIEKVSHLASWRGLREGIKATHRCAFFFALIEKQGGRGGAESRREPRQACGSQSRSKRRRHARRARSSCPRRRVPPPRPVRPGSTPYHRRQRMGTGQETASRDQETPQLCRKSRIAIVSPAEPVPFKGNSGQQPADGFPCTAGSSKSFRNESTRWSSTPIRPEIW